MHITCVVTVRVDPDVFQNVQVTWEVESNRERAKPVLDPAASQSHPTPTATSPARHDAEGDVLEPFGADALVVRLVRVGISATVPFAGGNT